jgi:uncharacterized protein (TIGR02118 family)
MYQIVVSYAQPSDPQAFLDYYRNSHVPVATKIPGVRHYGWIVCKRPDGEPPAHFVIAVLRFDSEQDAMDALGSPEGQAAVADVANFAQAGLELEMGEVISEI